MSMPLRWTGPLEALSREERRILQRRGESLTDDARRGRVVQRFLAEVESRAGEAAGAVGGAAGEQVRS